MGTRNVKGAIFISNLPYGFFEGALMEFFKQFGDILRVKLGRSKKNAKPMGWAYIEFQHEGVAKIAAKTMNGYLLYNRILKCHFIEHNRITRSMFHNSNLKPQFCRGTKRKRREQYKREKDKDETFANRLNKKLQKKSNYVTCTLGLKIKPDGKSAEAIENPPITMEIDEVDEEIILKTPPHVVKKIKKGVEKAIT